jgi:hypothetical protein
MVKRPKNSRGYGTDLLKRLKTVLILERRRRERLCAELLLLDVFVLQHPARVQRIMLKEGARRNNALQLILPGERLNQLLLINT